MTEKITPSPPEKSQRESIKERALGFLEPAQEFLLLNLGIDNLSTIEIVRLREFIEECLTQEAQEENWAKRGKLPLYGIWTCFPIIDEAVTRWLAELYNIDASHIPIVYRIKDSTDEKFFEYQGWQAEEYEKKIKELHQLGHNISFYPTIAKDFKEYLRRLRAKSHHPPLE